MSDEWGEGRGEQKKETDHRVTGDTEFRVRERRDSEKDLSAVWRHSMA